MVFRRAFEVPAGARVLVVEDVVTTGGSVAEVIDLVCAAGGEVAGVVSLIDRGGDKKFAAPFWPLLRLEVESWAADSCGLCADERARLLAWKPPAFVVPLGISAGQGVA